MPDKKNAKWKLSMGCHRRTLTSRDASVEEYDSLEECRRAVKKAEETWRRIGYYVWFAKAYGPNGEEIRLHFGTPYH